MKEFGFCEKETLREDGKKAAPHLMLEHIGFKVSFVNLFISWYSHTDGSRTLVQQMKNKI